MARLTSIDMGGHIDDVFQSHVGTRTLTGGDYVVGIWQGETPIVTTHRVNVQPLNQKDINFLTLGGQRVQDTKKIYINDGTMASITPAGKWTFVDVTGDAVDGTYKCVSLDNRPSRNYCKFYAVRLDV